MSRSIDAPGRRRSPQASMTSENAVSIRISKRVHALRRDLETLSPPPLARGMTPLGSGDQLHAGKSPTGGMGKTPAGRLPAACRVPRSAPTPTISSLPRPWREWRRRSERLICCGEAPRGLRAVPVSRLTDSEFPHAGSGGPSSGDVRAHPLTGAEELAVRRRLALHAGSPHAVERQHPKAR